MTKIAVTASAVTVDGTAVNVFSYNDKLWVQTANGYSEIVLTANSVTYGGKEYKPFVAVTGFDITGDYLNNTNSTISVISVSPTAVTLETALDVYEYNDSLWVQTANGYSEIVLAASSVSYDGKTYDKLTAKTFAATENIDAVFINASGQITTNFKIDVEATNPVSLINTANGEGTNFEAYTAGGKTYLKNSNGDLSELAVSQSGCAVFGVSYWAVTAANDYLPVSTVYYESSLDYSQNGILGGALVVVANTDANGKFAIGTGTDYASVVAINGKHYARKIAVSGAQTYTEIVKSEDAISYSTENTTVNGYMMTSYTPTAAEIGEYISFNGDAIDITTIGVDGEFEYQSTTIVLNIINTQLIGVFQMPTVEYLEVTIDDGILSMVFAEGSSVVCCRKIAAFTSVAQANVGEYAVIDEYAVSESVTISANGIVTKDSKSYQLYSIAGDDYCLAYVGPSEVKTIDYRIDKTEFNSNSDVLTLIKNRIELAVRARESGLVILDRKENDED